MLFHCISDTHNNLPEIPDGDVLIHAGDACVTGDSKETGDFVKKFSKYPHKWKIYTPGNHDRWAWDHTAEMVSTCKDYGIEMLIDRKITVEGLTIFASPWTRAFGWTRAFMYAPRDEKRAYSSLGRCSPSIDILVTHNPPNGYFDQCPHPEGSNELLWHIQRIQPKYHVFGHIHEGHGCMRRAVWDDTGKTTVFANVARSQPRSFQPVDDPIFTFELTV